MNRHEPLPTLCGRDPRRDAYLRDVLVMALDILGGAPTFRDATVILTGSLARGEASVVLCADGYESLSDMEFLVTLKNPPRSLSPGGELADIEAEVNRAVREKGFCCHVEFTYALHRYFSEAKPSIFSHELRSCGKVVAGSDEPISLMRTYSPEQIPRIDAFNMICNRVIEQLESLKQISLFHDDRTMRIFRYAIVKFYIDMATSILVFVGQYVPGYQQRRDAIRVLDWNRVKALPRHEELVGKIDAWTEVKLAPTLQDLRYDDDAEALAEWRELAGMALSVWAWEAEQLAASGSAGSGVPAAGAGRFEVLAEMFRSQARYLRRILKGGGVPLPPLRYLCGDPRQRLYADAVSMYKGLALAMKSCGGDIRSELRNHFDDIDTLIDTWRHCFRNS